MPPKSRVLYKEISPKRDDGGGNQGGTYLVHYDLVNLYDNQKNFLVY
jgi:hypothetical protein